MKLKSILFIVLALFVAAIFSRTSIIRGAEKADDYVKVVYFHGDYRCSACIKLEEYSKETVEKYFSKELKSGELKWTTINYDRDKNKHYIKDFQLYTKSLIIIRYKNGKIKEWKNCQKVWQKIRDKSDYFKYVKEEVEDYMEKV